MIPDEGARSAARLAVLALRDEARTAPKPGLVDPFHAGAHKDMDYRLLLRSAGGLESYFADCFLEGRNFRGDDPREIFGALRLLGRGAEKGMFSVTGGVNTHKGAIFSLGLLVAAAGLGHPSRESARDAPAPIDPEGEICLAAGKICAGIVERDLRLALPGGGARARESPTAGERLFRNMGILGIRGEAESGFPVLRSLVLPALRRARREPLAAPGASCFGPIPAPIRVDALLSSMAVLEDSCLLARGGREGLEAVRLKAREILEAGGSDSAAGAELLAALDRFCCEANLSPGGSADMLSSGLFLMYWTAKERMGFAEG
jgi:triphosphoribosyl-dephospho-CoA synthetase